MQFLPQNLFSKKKHLREREERVKCVTQKESKIATLAPTWSTFGLNGLFLIP